MTTDFQPAATCQSVWDWIFYLDWHTNLVYWRGWTQH